MSYQLEVIYSLKNASLVDNSVYELSGRIRLEKVSTGEKLKNGSTLEETQLRIRLEVQEDNRSEGEFSSSDPYCEKAEELMWEFKKACGILGIPLNVDQDGVYFSGGASLMAGPSVTVGTIPIILGEKEIKELKAVFDGVVQSQSEYETRLSRIGEFVFRGYKFHIFETDQELAFYNFWRACEIAGRHLIKGQIVHSSHWQNPSEKFDISEENFTSEDKDTLEKVKNKLRAIQPSDFIYEDFADRVENFQNKDSLGHTLDLCYALRGEIFHYGNTNEEVLSVLYSTNKLLSEVIIPEFLELMEDEDGSN